MEDSSGHWYKPLPWLIETVWGYRRIAWLSVFGTLRQIDVGANTLTPEYLTIAHSKGLDFLMKRNLQSNPIRL
jgi:hypothetical protein